MFPEFCHLCAGKAVKEIDRGREGTETEKGQRQGRDRGKEETGKGQRRDREGAAKGQGRGREGTGKEDIRQESGQ